MANILSIVMFFPITFGVVLALFGRLENEASTLWFKRLALAITVITFVLSLFLLFGFDPANTEFQFYEESYISDFHNSLQRTHHLSTLCCSLPCLSFHALMFTKNCPQVLECIHLLQFLLPQPYHTSKYSLLPHSIRPCKINSLLSCFLENHHLAFPCIHFQLSPFTYPIKCIYKPLKHPFTFSQHHFVYCLSKLFACYWKINVQFNLYYTIHLH